MKLSFIKKTTESYYGVSVLEKTRRPNVTRVRYVIMYLGRTLTTRSLEQIALTIGRTNHTTILHGLKRMEVLLNEDETIESEINDIKRMLGV